MLFPLAAAVRLLLLVVLVFELLFLLVVHVLLLVAVLLFVVYVLEALRVDFISISLSPTQPVRDLVSLWCESRVSHTSPIVFLVLN